MKIKPRYFTKGVFPCLIKDVDAACKPFEESFREELFDKLSVQQHGREVDGTAFFFDVAG